VIVADRHDAALYAWRDAGIRGAVLVHVDAHHDADALEWDFVTISNFVWWALAEGVLREAFWVVPEPNWDTESRRALIEQSLATLVRQHDASGTVESGERCFRASIAGKPFTACSLRSLPAARGALLDVDVDYFLVPDIAEELPPIEGSMPWIWPADLLEALRAAVVNPAVVTVATSTRGGFTPLEWKYLGEELCARFDGGTGEGFEALRSGVEAERLGDLDGAQARYQEAIRLLPSSAGARYRLSRLHLLRGEDDAARRAFRDVVERDVSYRAIDSEGRRWHAAGNLAAAARGYRDTLRMDPENPYAELGLAQLAAAAGDHAGAIVHFERALQSCGTLVDAHRGIARSLQGTGAIDRASRHYARSLRLELLGHAPIDAPIATRPRAPRVFDAAHWDIHRRLAALQHDTRWLEALDRVRTEVV
jgi:Tfp pilus assembly protein PilF